MEEQDDRSVYPKGKSHLQQKSQIGAPQLSGFAKIAYDPSQNKTSFTPQLNQSLGIDRQSIIEHYRNLRQQQKDILSRVNMKEDLKRQIFGFPESYYCSNEAQKVKLVTVIDPFAGRLVVTEQKWKQMQALKKEKRNKQRQNRTNFHNTTSFKKQQPHLQSQNGYKKNKNLAQRRHRTSIQENEQIDDKNEEKKKNDSGQNVSNFEKNLLAMLGNKKDEDKKMNIEQIGEQIFENKKSQISSIHNFEQNEEIMDSADQLMHKKYQYK